MDISLKNKKTIIFVILRQEWQLRGHLDCLKAVFAVSSPHLLWSVLILFQNVLECKCCVLHNICLLKNDDFASTVELLPEVVHDRDPVGGIVAVNRLAILKRDNICERLSIRNV